MTQFVLTPEQETFLFSGEGRVAVYSSTGRVAGYLSPVPPDFQVYTPESCPFTPDEIAAAEKAAMEPGQTFSTTKEVFERLYKLRKP